jgi:hypothetical protein
MTADELVEILARMHHDGYAAGEAKIMMILFGIKYADEIRACGQSTAMLAKRATTYENYGNEIGQGIKLARYVQPRHARLS